MFITTGMSSNVGRGQLFLTWFLLIGMFSVFRNIEPFLTQFVLPGIFFKCSVWRDVSKAVVNNWNVFC